MADLIVRPTKSGVHLPFWDTGGGTVSVVGAPPQWGDNSDATYADTTGSHRLVAEFPAIPNAATFDFIVYVRCQSISGNPPVMWELRSTSTSEELCQSAGPDFPAPDVPTTLAMPMTASNADVIDALRNDDVEVSVSIWDGPGTLRVFDVWIGVATTDPILEEVWFASPIRQRQRADGLGLSSASRTSQLRTKQGSLRGGPNGVD